MEAINKVSLKQKMRAYMKNPLSLFLFLISTVAALFTIFVLVFLIGYILMRGLPYIKPSLFALKYTTENVSLFPAIISTIMIIAISLTITVPLGVSTAIYLIEYAHRGSRLVEVIRLTTETLAGIPSIVYGLFGTLFFVTTLKMGFSILSGSLTIAIMILPLIIRVTEEALKSVPDTYREASFGLGAGRLRTVFLIVLPAAMPGVLAGIVLAIGRIAGETAALIYTAGTVAKIPSDVLQSGRTLAVHMYALSSEGLYTGQAYATAVVLLVVVILMNGLSSLIGKRLMKG